MVHKRSLAAMQRRAANRAARQHGFKDRLLNEKDVTKETVPKIWEHVHAETLKKTGGKTGFVLPEILQLHQPGDVLEDPLGRGTLQQPTEDLTRQKTQHQFKHTQQADGLT